MEFGIHHQLACSNTQAASTLYNEAIEQTLLAESLGFESVWPVEHHFNARVSSLSSPMLFLSALAAKTHTIKLGTAITLLPLAHPVRVAEEIATLDILSNGRFEFGFGRGGIPYHFEGFNVSMEESRDRMLESLTVIEGLLGEESFNFSGQFYQVESLSIAAKPIQTPFPLPRAAANSAETFELMGSMGYPVFAASHINPFFMLGDLISNYRTAIEESNNPRKHNSVDLLCPVYVGETAKSVRDALEPSLMNYKQVALDQIAPNLSNTSIPGLRARLDYLASMTFETYARDMGIFGTPDECRERIDTLKHGLGIDRLLCWFNPGGLVTHDNVKRSIRLFAEQVMPSYLN